MFQVRALSSHLGEATAGYQPSLVDDGDSVAELLSNLKQMRTHEDCPAIFRVFHQIILELPLEDWVEVDERLVEEQQARVRNKSPRGIQLLWVSLCNGLS